MNLPGVFFLFPTYEVMIMLQKDSPAVYDTAVMKKEATRVSLVNIAGNTALSVFKLLAGILAHSGAMISDAVHSASDVLSSFIVIIGVKLAAREPDRDHPYGHERIVRMARPSPAFSPLSRRRSRSYQRRSCSGTPAPMPNVSAPPH